MVLGRGGYTLTPAHPFKQSSGPSWISNKNLCRGTAFRWRCDAGPLPASPARPSAPPPPPPISLLDSLSVAVSLALLPDLAAATAGFAVGPFPAAAGLAHLAGLAGLTGLAGLADVLQRGAGVSPLQPVVLQELGLEDGQVVLAAPDLGAQQHDVSAVPRFLQKVETETEKRDSGPSRDSGGALWFPDPSPISPRTPGTRPAGGTPLARAL